MHARTKAGTMFHAMGVLPALAVLAVLAGCGGHARSGAAPEVVVVTAPVEFAQVAPPVLASGVLAGQSEVPLAFKIGGVIARLDAEAGQGVRAGQAIASLQAAEIDAAVAKAQAAADKSERDYARARALVADSVITRTLFDDAGTARDVARSDLRTARFNQRYAAIVAPAAGTVLRRLAEPGQTVGPGTPIVVFSADGSGQVVRVGLADRDVVRVRAGDTATVTFGALPGRTWSGHVTSWVDAPAIRVHVVRYEDMKLRAEETFGAAVRFVDLPADPDRVRKAIEFSRFEEVRKQEEKDGFGEKMPRAKSFFRKGEIGSWRESLTPEQAARIVADHSDVMRRFGYLDDHGKPVF